MYPVFRIHLADIRFRVGLKQNIINEWFFFLGG